MLDSKPERGEQDDRASPGFQQQAAVDSRVRVPNVTAGFLDHGSLDSRD